MTGTAGDLRYAVRRLWKERGLTGIALLTLALCIGANTAIFSMVYALLLKPLPFPAPTRIIEIYNNFPKAGINKLPSNYVQYFDFKANTTALEAAGLWVMTPLLVGDEGSNERTSAASCTADMFDVLGIKPVIGQFFTPKNSVIGEDAVMVLTQSFWESHFNGDPGVLNKPIQVDGITYHIIGVAPRSLESFNAQVKFLRPLSWRPAALDPRGRYGCTISLYARLKSDAPASVALAQIAGLEQHVHDTASPLLRGFLDRSGHTVSISLVQAERVEPIKTSLYLLQGGVVFVLLIGCVNVANLLLTRANGQQSELAIRAALGAGRGAIARQLLVDSLLLTFSGALLGVGLAYGAVNVINHYTAKLLPNMLPIAIDGSVLCYTLGISVAVGLLMGLLPVVHILNSNLAAVINRSSRATSGGWGVRAISSALVTGQVAIALVLLCGAGLLIHSFANAIAVDPGFDSRNLVSGNIALPRVLRAQQTSAAVLTKLQGAMREIPGMDDTALATSIPYEGGLPILALTLRDSTLPRNSPQPGAYLIGVSEDYFKTLHVQLLSGRFLDKTDTAKGARSVYVVDERFEQKYFPGRSAVGGHFTFGPSPANEADWPLIVGVVRNVPYNGVDDKSEDPFVYYPLITSTPGTLSLSLSVFARSSRPVGDVVSALREKVRAVGPTMVLFDAGPMQKVIDDSFDSRRGVMLLLAGFAVLALFLSAIGIYGVLAYDVSQRTREIGIRGAIGASQSQIIGLIMRQSIWKTGVGLVVGLASAVMLSRFMVSMLFELKASDPWTYVGVSLILAIVALFASYLPARRAAAIDPIQALRTD